MNRFVEIVFVAAVVCSSTRRFGAASAAELPSRIRELRDVSYDGKIGFHVGKLDALGFHGDLNLLRGVDAVAPLVTRFVETGTHAASTLHYVERTYPRIERLYSCEPNEEYFRTSTKHMDTSQNRAWRDRVKIWNKTSQEMMRDMASVGGRDDFFHDRDLFREPSMFWLDAHGSTYFDWPLREEIAFVATRWTDVDAYVFVDDFKVPSEPRFGFDVVDGRECSYEYIRSAIPDDVPYRVYYPSYVESTSSFCPLRGWAMIHFPPARRGNAGRRAVRRFDVEHPDIFLLGHQGGDSNDELLCEGVSPSVTILSPYHGDIVRLNSEETLRLRLVYDCVSISAATRRHQLCMSLAMIDKVQGGDDVVAGEMFSQCFDNVDIDASRTQDGRVWDVTLAGLTVPAKYAVNVALKARTVDGSSYDTVIKRFSVFDVATVP